MRVGNSDELQADSIVIDRALIDKEEALADKEAALAESKAECKGLEDLKLRIREHVEELESEIYLQARRGVCYPRMLGRAPDPEALLPLRLVMR